MQWHETTGTNGYRTERIGVTRDRGEFFDWITDPAVATVADQHSHDTDRPKWFGTATFNEAAEMFRTGWTDVLDDVQGIGNRYAATMADRFVLDDVKRWTTSGGALSVPKFLTDRPDCYRRRRPEEQTAPRRLVRIGSLAIWSSLTSQAQLLERGAAVAALVAVLESAGCSVELITSMLYESRDEDRLQGVVVPLKGAADPMHLPSMVFGMAHSSMLRRLGFAAAERFQEPRVWGIYRGGGYGRVPNSDKAARSLEAVVGKCDVVVPSPGHGGRNDWTDWLDSTLRELGFQAI
jgi:hypothetical protein